MNLKLARKFNSALKLLNTPWKIQEYVSKIPYNPKDDCFSVEKVFLRNKAHCLEGALFAAVALERLGHEPQLLHLRSHRDDDHVVALFKEKNRWGAIGKSNTTLLRWRSPLFQSLEALLMSYFPFYFNTKGQMSLVSWAGPVRLKKYEKKWRWRDTDKEISDMGASFYSEKSHRILSTQAIEKYPRASKELIQVCFL